MRLLDEGGERAGAHGTPDWRLHGGAQEVHDVQVLFDPLEVKFKGSITALTHMNQGNRIMMRTRGGGSPRRQLIRVSAHVAPASSGRLTLVCAAPAGP